MEKQKRTRKYVTMKQVLSLKDQRLKEKDRLKPKRKENNDPRALKESSLTPFLLLFLQYNTQLCLAYHILLDTKFIKFLFKAKLDLVQLVMGCLYAKCIPHITDCVMAETEKLGQKHRVVLKIDKEPRLERLPHTHKATYVDDCLVQRLTQHRCYVVTPVDQDLERRIRKTPGVPIMYISNYRCNTERIPHGYGAPRF
ncbi:rRNA-processing protein FCF1 homolog [Sturnira hondurensis]|uniref:rRNA-processing protein FCF1 homolog n=1 Tax=Sturnira hondurensis TaxID=192404 RepID=UPI00187AF58E|nr:rRNA-processing protein FCF1 homolog [Sturnira hondurensis]